jgi:hypothetical protein
VARAALAERTRERQFETAVDWGRYAELFTYDDSAGELTLDEEHRLGRS